MSTNNAYVLPLKGLGKGLYEYDMRVDDRLFASVDNCPVRGAAVDLHVEVSRQTRQMVIDFDFRGTVATSCDRCLADIDLPVADRRQLIVKFSDEADDQQDEGDIVYLHPDTHDFNLEPFVYEIILLAVPLIRTYACREGEKPYPCDEDLLDRIDASYESPDDAPIAPEPEKPSPWDVLKGLNKNA